MEQQKTKQTPAKLPTVAELLTESNNLEQGFRSDKLNYLLSQKIPDSWVREHEIIKIKTPSGYRPLKYLPIERVEYLMKKIFKRYRIEVIEYKQVFNSVSCHVRVHYINPTNGEWDFQDGVGAVGIQVDKGSQASDLSAIKHDSVMKALPASKSYAIKDAMENLGSLFGANLNRKDDIEYMPDQELMSREQQRIEKLKQHGINV